LRIICTAYLFNGCAHPMTCEQLGRCVGVPRSFGNEGGEKYMAKAQRQQHVEESENPAPQNATTGGTPPVASTQVTIQQERKSVPSFLASRTDDAGKGVSDAAVDNIVPMLKILQPLSPECSSEGSDGIPEAEPGMIMLRGAPRELHPGEAGVEVQPIYFYRKWNRWVSRKKGGGFVCSYDIPEGERAEDHLPEGARLKQKDPDDEDKRDQYVMEGDELIETRYYVTRIRVDGDRFPFVIPFTSTGHTPAKQWMGLIRNKRFPDGRAMPAWAGVYRLKTRHKENSQGEWWIPVITDLGYVETEAEYEAGKALYQAWVRGDKEAATPEAEGAADTGEDYDSRV
jgi:hypothetical protein